MNSYILKIKNLNTFTRNQISNLISISFKEQESFLCIEIELDNILIKKFEVDIEQKYLKLSFSLNYLIKNALEENETLFFEEHIELPDYINIEKYDKRTWRNQVIIVFPKKLS